MARKVYWRSWSKLEADFELGRLRGLMPEHEWVDAHKHQPGPGDIYLTTNGYDWRGGSFLKASLYAESYVYLKAEYDKWRTNRKWNHRFHFNPNYYKLQNCSYQGIGTWWKREISLFEQLKGSKTINHQFGMCLGRKPEDRSNPANLGYIRSEVVRAGRKRSFRYYGTKWPAGDPNYGGEKYLDGHRGTPVKFHDARRLMSDVKFVFVFENTFDEHYSRGYLTEKIWHAFLSRSVPVYAGCWDVEELLPDVFIDARKFGMNMGRVFEHCERMPDSVYQGYLDRIEEFLCGDGQKFSCDERFVELDKQLVRVFG